MRIGTSDSVVLNGRYRLEEVLGEGSSGIVHAAHDLTLDRRVAVKVISGHDPDRVYRLKREFRELAQLLHPNLVRLHELFVGPDLCFIAMECVSGVDFVAHCRESERAVLPRLREAARQLVLGVSAVHDARKLHRDLKPGNVLVDRSGRVVVLDFGLVSSLDSAMSIQSRAGTLAGTLPYMAPEQMHGRSVSPASDWYSVGVMLYESLFGALPYDFRQLLSVRPYPPALPHCFDGEAKPWADLIVRLLHPNPDARPGAETLLSFLEPTVTTSIGKPGSATLVGRDTEVAQLRNAFERACAGECAVVEVSGESGIGKSTLLSHFTSGLEATVGAVVLVSRCHPRESVSFNAVDAIVDELARYLASQNQDELALRLPRSFNALTALFPVLKRAPALARAMTGEVVPAQAQELRQRAITALRELLVVEAARRPMVIWIDDFQWADVDSVKLLDELLRPPDAPRLLVLLSSRGGGDRPARTDALHVRLGPLCEADLRRIIALDCGSPSSVTLDQAVAESLGNPLVARTLSRESTLFASPAVASSDSGGLFDRVIARRAAALPASGRTLLEIVALAGRPIPEAIARAALAMAGHVSWSERSLDFEELVSAVPGAGGTSLEIVHDRTRNAIARLVPPESQAQIHRWLADALEVHPDGDPDLAVSHALLAQDDLRACQLALRAAERAMESLAFNRAVSLYRRAVDLDCGAAPIWSVLARLADALSNAGFVAEAGDTALRAAEMLEAEEPQHPSVRRLRREAASHLMRSGEFKRGLEVMRSALEAEGIWYPRKPSHAVASILANRLRLAALRARSQPQQRDDPDARERLDSYWLAGAGHSMFDSTRAADFQVRHAILAHRIGEPGHLARALATEGLLRSWEGGRRARRASERLQALAKRLSRIADDPKVEAHRLLMEAGGALIERRVSSALSLCEQGESMCRDRCTGVAWELAGFHHTSLAALAALGELALLRTRCAELVREATDRGDENARIMLQVGTINLGWMAEERSEEALRNSEAAVAAAGSNSTLALYQGLYGLVLIELHLHRPLEALRRLESSWTRLRASQALRLQSVRVEMLELRARTAIAAALTAGRGDRTRWLASAARDARRLTREDSQWSAPFTDALQASLACCADDSEAAELLLERSATGFERLELRLNASCARHQLGSLLGGSRGDALRSEACAWLHAHGVLDPAKMSNTWIPIR